MQAMSWRTRVAARAILVFWQLRSGWLCTHAAADHCASSSILDEEAISFRQNALRVSPSSLYDQVRDHSPFLSQIGATRVRLARHDDMHERYSDGDASQGLPADVSIFERRWQLSMERARLEDSASPKRVPEFHAVFGVFSSWKNDGFRQVIRRTWMQQQSVCKSVSEADRKNGCFVSAVFVIAKVYLQVGKINKTIHDEEELQLDGVLLDTPENQNFGKTLRWFQYAVRTFPWATHFGKLDQDVFPFFSKLPLYVPPKDKDCHVYLGAAWHLVNQWSTCYTYLNEVGELPTYSPNTCTVFMNGGFHLTDRALLEGAARVGGFWDEHPDWGGEDCMNGLGIMEYARETGACIKTWAEVPEGLWQHWKSWKMDAPEERFKQVNFTRELPQCFRHGEARLGLFDFNGSSEWGEVNSRQRSWHSQGWGTMPQQRWGRRNAETDVYEPGRSPLGEERWDHEERHHFLRGAQVM